jgi:hypothetical protein
LIAKLQAYFFRSLLVVEKAPCARLPACRKAAQAVLLDRQDGAGLPQVAAMRRVGFTDLPKDQLSRFV